MRGDRREHSEALVAIVGPGEPCGLCADGTFDHDGDPATPCVPLTVCGDNEYAAIAASATSDRTCAPCPGKSTSKGPNAAFCTPYQPIFRAIMASHHHTCALDQDGVAHCFGHNDEEQAAPPKDVHFTTLAAGAYHTCGLDADGKFHWFGSNGDSQNNLPDLTFTAIAAGRFHTCALDTDGKAHCAGNNGAGQARPPDGVFTAITAGVDYNCGIRAGDRIAICWGEQAQNLWR